MSTDPVFIIGGGGHGRVVADALLCARPGVEIVILDQSPDVAGRQIGALRVRHSPDLSEVGNGRFHVAIGDNAIRARVFSRLLESGGEPETVMHPRATLADDARVGRGVLLAAGSVIAPGVELGDGCIANHGALVDHDNRIGEFCHLGPGSRLAGDIVLGSHVLIGIGATLMPAVRIAHHSVVGAGAVVDRSWDVEAVLVGVPARPLAAGQKS